MTPREFYLVRAKDNRYLLSDGSWSGIDTSWHRGARFDTYDSARKALKAAWMNPPDGVADILHATFRYAQVRCTK